MSIAVRCRNRIEWAVIALACAKIDARLLTLDPDLPPRVLRERLIASRAAAVIVGDTAPVRLAPALEGLSLRLRATHGWRLPGLLQFLGPVPARGAAAFWPRAAFAAGLVVGRRRALPVACRARRAAPASVSRPPDAGYTACR